MQVRTFDKVLSIKEATETVRKYREESKTIVFTNGCFDCLHAGHVSSLEAAAQFGDVLIVAINDDDSVTRLKGVGRPIIPARDRALVLAALACVDCVVVFSGDTPLDLLHGLKPDFLVKGGTTTDVVGREVVESYGGTVCVTEAVVGRSTTEILRQILDGSHE